MQVLVGGGDGLVAHPGLDRARVDASGQPQARGDGAGRADAAEKGPRRWRSAQRAQHRRPVQVRTAGGGEEESVGSLPSCQPPAIRRTRLASGTRRKRRPLVALVPTPSGAERRTSSPGVGTSTRSSTRRALASAQRRPVHPRSSRTSASRWSSLRCHRRWETSSSSSVHGRISTCSSDDRGTGTPVTGFARSAAPGRTRRRSSTSCAVADHRALREAGAQELVEGAGHLPAAHRGDVDRLYAGGNLVGRSDWSTRNVLVATVIRRTSSHCWRRVPTRWRPARGSTPPSSAARSRDSHALASRFVSNVRLVTNCRPLLVGRGAPGAGLDDGHATPFSNHFSTSSRR